MIENRPRSKRRIRERAGRIRGSGVRPLHIALATRIFAPESAAAALRLNVLVKELSRAGHAVTVLTTRPPNAVPAAAPVAGVRVRRWPVLRDKTGQLRGYLNYMSFDIPLLFRLFRPRRVDAVICEPPPTTGAVTRVVCAMRRIPYVYYAADVWSDAVAGMDAPRVVEKMLRSVESWTLRGAALVVAVSDGVAERVRELGARRVLVAPNGIDTDVFTPSVPPLSGSERERYGIAGPYFLYAGTASEWQGPGVFIEALAEVRGTHPDVQLLFVGQGSEWEALKAQAARLFGRQDRLRPGAPAQPGSPASSGAETVVGEGRASGGGVQSGPATGKRAEAIPAVVFHGLVPPGEAARLQRDAVASVVSIVPGIGYDMAYPTKILAALACGTPVIYAGPGPAVGDIRGNELGAASPYEARAVAAAMRTMLDGVPPPAERLSGWVRANRSMGAAARAVVIRVAEL